MQDQSSLSKEDQDIEDAKLISELSLVLEAEPYADLSSSNIITIRHAYTEQNKDQHQYEVRRGGIFKQEQEWRDLMLHPKYYDTPLHSVGVKMCLANRSQINKVDFELVLVSPMRRTLQTCILLFSEHPRRDKIKFLIFPLISEAFVATSCIGYNTNAELRQRMTEQASKVGITLDYSLFDSKLKPYTWQYEQIEDETMHKDYLELLKTVQNEQEYIDHSVSLMAGVYPEYLENWGLLLKRSFKARQEIKEILKKYPDIQSNKRKLGIVSHQLLIRCLTSDKLEENGEAKGAELKNCQMCPVFI